MATRDVTPEQLASILEETIPAVLAELALELKNRAFRAAFLEIVALSPAASGKYRASHRGSLGNPEFVVLPNATSFPVPGAAEIDAVLAGSTTSNLETPLFIANAAADARRPDDSYAGVLELGRHVDSRGRAAGSLQAPSGIYGPAMAAILARAAEIEEDAIRAVEARFGL